MDSPSLARERPSLDSGSFPHLGHKRGFSSVPSAWRWRRVGPSADLHCCPCPEHRSPGRRRWGPSLAPGSMPPMSRHTHPKAGATAPRCPSPGLGNDDPPKSPFAPQTQRLRPPAPGIQESVPSSLGSSFPFLLHFLVFSRTFPAVPSGSTC